MARYSSKVERDLGVVQGQLGQLITEVANLSKGVGTRLHDAEERINTIENRQYKAWGALLACSFVLTKIDFTQLFAALTVIH